MKFSNKLNPKRLLSLFAATVMALGCTACVPEFDTNFPVADDFDNYRPVEEDVQLRVLTDKSQNVL